MYMVARKTTSLPKDEGLLIAIRDREDNALNISISWTIFEIEYFVKITMVDKQNYKL